MTKAEAIAALERGEKITHHYMEPHEYVKRASDGSGRIECEEGYIISPAIFWIDRRGSHWDNGWELFNPKQL